MNHQALSSTNKTEGKSLGAGTRKGMGDSVLLALLEKSETSRLQRACCQVPVPQSEGVRLAISRGHGIRG